MKIALGQFDVIPGDPLTNSIAMASMMEQASQQGCGMIAFPELCVGGYMLGDLWLDDEYCIDLMRYNEAISAIAKKCGIAVSFGNIYLEEDINARLGIEGHHTNHDGRRRRYNAVYVLDKYGNPAKRCFDEDNYLPKGVEIKTNLPNYRIFDDERYFFSKLDHCLDFGIPLKSAYVPFLIGDEKIGIALCEDLWCEDYRHNGKSINPTLWLIQNSAHAVINASSSPWTYGKNGARDRRTAYVYDQVAKECKTTLTGAGGQLTTSWPEVPMFYVNCIGIQNNGKNLVIFDGGSTIYDGQGHARVYDDQYREQILIGDTHSGYLPPATPRVELPEIAQKYKGIRWAIKRFLKETPIVNGLSGGIDSCVTAALYADALGKEKVIGINMPSQHNKQITKAAASKCAKALNIRYRVIPIEDMAKVTREMLQKYILDRVWFPDVSEDHSIPQIVDENLQAKTRAIGILSNIAQVEGGVFSCNGNKVELAIGYYTLDADGRGALNPIGDLTKEEVYELGHYLNEVFGKEVVPAEALNPEIIVPSAELANGQYDPIKVGYHCRITRKMTNYMIASATTFMEEWLKGTLHTFLGSGFFGDALELMQKYGMTDGTKFVDDLIWYLGRERNQVFKRVQSVPIIMVSKTAYGYDRRESILPPYQMTAKAAELATKIKAQGTYNPSIVA